MHGEAAYIQSHTALHKHSAVTDAKQKRKKKKPSLYPTCRCSGINSIYCSWLMTNVAAQPFHRPCRLLAAVIRWIKCSF